MLIEGADIITTWNTISHILPFIYAKVSETNLFNEWSKDTSKEKLQ
jgi:hypothetical protein